MSIDIENIFKATARSTSGFLIAAGQGCYLPAYQRPYSWDRDNAERLFEDAIHGMNMLPNRKDTITFLGTIIAINDTKHRTIKPIYKSEVASKVMTIIDGQQRLCTFAMINVALHDHIRRSANRFKNKQEPHLSWLYDQSQRLLPELLETLVLDMRTGEDSYRFYPRIIRAYDDAWSRKKVQAKYTSPIARLIWEYFGHQESNSTRVFRYNPKDETENTLAQHKSVTDMYQFVQRRVVQITDRDAENVDFPSVISIINSKDFVDAIWGFELPEEIQSYITNESDDALYGSVCQLFRMIVIAQYMNLRMAFTVVTTESEDDAFDMFEALNTTGEPLTAFETFKPRVIETEELEHYEQSASHDWIARIEEYLERFRKAEQKQKATSEMLVPFALSETGEKLQKRLNDQRRYLRDQYDGLQSLNQKRDFVQRLSDIAYFMLHAWDVERGNAPTFYPLAFSDNDALVGFEALRSINHHITVAAISRFYGRALHSDDSTRAKRTDEFIDAIKATVAFSVLWRGAFGGTENIDSHYRDIMRQGVPKEKINPLACRPKTGTGAVSISNYKKALRHYLASKGKISGKADWVKSATKTPIYRHSKDVARLILFCASDDTVPDKSAPGLIKRGRSGIAPMMNLERWHNESYFTVEHIAPQNAVTGWDTEIYDDPDTVHRLGNLLLLPQDENAFAGNRPWPHKRLLYKLLSATDGTEFSTAKKECEKAGLNFSNKAEEILEKSSYLGMCKSVAALTGEWKTNFIQKRSERIAELAWNRLAPWLELQ